MFIKRDAFLFMWSPQNQNDALPFIVYTIIAYGTTELFTAKTCTDGDHSKKTVQNSFAILAYDVILCYTIMVVGIYAGVVQW